MSDEASQVAREIVDGFNDAMAAIHARGLGGEVATPQEAIDYLADEVASLKAALAAAEGRGRQEGKDYAWNEVAAKAAASAHRACCGVEANNAEGKIHGYCVVCGVPWPCVTAQFFLQATPPTPRLTWTRERPSRPGWYWYQWANVNRAIEVGMFPYQDGPVQKLYARGFGWIDDINNGLWSREPLEPPTGGG